MAAEIKKKIQLEIAHVLFLDIVGYSKLSVNEQYARVDELNGIVRLSGQFQRTPDWNGNAYCAREKLANTTRLIFMPEPHPCYPFNPWFF